MRRLLSWIALAACSTPPATSSEQQPLIGPPSGTPTFPTTQVGQTSAAQTYYIYETTRTVGFHSDTISSISYSCPDFSVQWAAGVTSDDCTNDGCGTASMAPTGSQQEHPSPYFCPAVLDCEYDDIYSFSATFHPTVAAALSCVLTITGSANTQTYTLSGTGTPPPIHVTASPPSIAFGGVRVMTDSTPVAVTITNSGGSPATINSVAVSSGFVIQSGSTGSHPLGSGSSEQDEIVCHPNATGGISGSVTISSNDPTSPTITLPLSCTGIDSTLQVSPSPAVLPTTRVGEPVQQTITMTNMGGAATTIQDVLITGVDTVSAPSPDTPLAAGSTVQAVVSFPATAAGAVSGNMHVDYDNGKSVDVAISGMALMTSMSLTPDGSVAFGPVCAGQTKTQAFGLIANADGPFQLTALSAPDMPFTVQAPSLPASVQGDAGNTVNFMVTAAPTDATESTSSVMLTTDIPNGQPDTIALDVIGLPMGVSATPPTVDVGPSPVATTTLAQPVNLTNCGTDSVTITSAEITGDDASSFAIVSNPSSMQVDSAATATWLVVMNSQTPGTKQATFEIDYAGGTTSVALSGEPFMPGAGSDSGSDVTEKSSYYACNTGRPAALWPLAAALAVLVLRRRRR
ncbi:MAG TPA: choice-of-anchor D domain-containing protein [Kofleriaceae bacterium]